MGNIVKGFECVECGERNKFTSHSYGNKGRYLCQKCYANLKPLISGKIFILGGALCIILIFAIVSSFIWFDVEVQFLVAVIAMIAPGFIIRQAHPGGYIKTKHDDT